MDTVFAKETKAVVNQDYRAILKNELEKRCTVNPRYSLRCFARDLTIAPPRLSQILNGKQGLSQSSAQMIAKKLGFSKQEQSIFCDLVESRYARSKAKRKLAAARLEQQSSLPFTQLEMDTFKVIADWYHLAIVELTRLKNFQSDPKWIAKQLGISVMQVKSAIARLLSLDLLTRDDKGCLFAKNPFNASPSDVPSESIKTFHRQILQKTIAALHTHAVEDRDFSSVILAFDASEMEKAKVLIQNFRRSFSQNIDPSMEGQDLYCLSIQFFKLNEGGTNNE